MGETEKRLEEMGITLPNPPVPMANYAPYVQVGELLFISGSSGFDMAPNGEFIVPIKGKLGEDLTVEEGYQSARHMGLNFIAKMKQAVGDLDNIVRMVRLVGYVHSAPDFKEAPWVLNGATDLFVEVFGPDRGKPARAALYSHTMTIDVPVEAELIVQVKN